MSNGDSTGETDPDKIVVIEADLALVAVTQKYMGAKPWERADIAPSMEQARNRWAAARYRLLFPDTVSTQADVAEARRLRAKIEGAADNQTMIQGVLELAGLLGKFAV